MKNKYIYQTQKIKNMFTISIAYVLIKKWNKKTPAIAGVFKLFVTPVYQKRDTKNILRLYFKR